MCHRAFSQPPGHSCVFPRPELPSLQRHHEEGLQVPTPSQRKVWEQGRCWVQEEGCQLDPSIWPLDIPPITPVVLLLWQKPHELAHSQASKSRPSKGRCSTRASLPLKLLLAQSLPGSLQTPHRHPLSSHDSCPQTFSREGDSVSLGS